MNRTRSHMNAIQHPEQGFHSHMLTLFSKADFVTRSNDRSGGRAQKLPAIYRISGKHIIKSGKRFGWCGYLYSVKSWQTYQYRLFSCSSWDALVKPLMSEREYDQSDENMRKTSENSSRFMLLQEGQTDF